MTFLKRVFQFLLISTLSFYALALETDLYDFTWLDKDKEVYVLQNRKFRKVNRFYIQGGYGMTTSGSFVDATAIQARAGYFFSEDYGFELVYSMNSGEENEAAKSVRSSGASGGGTVPFRRIVDNYYGAMFMWSPFYSKINSFNKIIYVDFLFGLGLATITETNNREQFVSDNPFADETQETHTGIMWNVGAKFFVNTSWSIRLDLNAIHYEALQARKLNPEDYIYSNYDLVASLVYDL
ncbi:MAG: outer membrane beta-barrel domain-containing protein [Bdellovibrionota bacterium]|nr:outer membrane beta-barrel domain-containing protein [Bdellovibrionota bacterium]|tara:strand:+ start:1097 stop:1813 length:717 start_codon:yes stop_codon:yes gene_type:complete